MKKLFLSLCISISVLLISAQAGTNQSITIPNAGLTRVYSPTTIPNTIYLNSDANRVLVGNVSISYSSLPPLGSRWRVYFSLDVDLNGRTFTLFNTTLQQKQIQINGSVGSCCGYMDFCVIKDFSGTPNLYYTYSPFTLEPLVSSIDGSILFDGTVPLDKLEGDIPLTLMDTIGRGRIIEGGAAGAVTSKFFGTNAYIGVGDGTDFLSVDMTGDVDITNAGVTAIQAGVIVNADVNASAAIAFSKMAALTASQVVTTTAGGVITTSATVSPTLGGTGQNTSASTGFPTISAGTWSVGTLTDVRGLDNLSFVTANQGTYYLYFPFAATATNLNCRVTSAVSGTDVGEITVANNGGTVMTGSSLTAGVLTVASGAVFGTGYSSTLLTNNTFTAGQSMQLTTAKVTTGGVMHCDVTYTRTQ